MKIESLEQPQRFIFKSLGAFVSLRTAADFRITEQTGDPFIVLITWVLWKVEIIRKARYNGY